MSRARDFADLAGSADAGGLTGKNLVTNGAMTVAQRGTSATISGDGDYASVDRFAGRTYGGSGRFSMAQDTTVPSGQNFYNSLKLTVTTTDTSGTYGYGIKHIIEGYNIAQLRPGSSDAKKTTLSFWARSSVAGTYCASIRPNGSAEHYVFEYTLAADTWKKIEHTIAAPTSATPSWNTTNGTGYNIEWSLGAQTSKITSTTESWASGNNHATSNQTDWINTSGATFYITGVQLEVGEQATPFDHSESYGETLARCQRYFFQVREGSGEFTQFAHGRFFSTSAGNALVRFPQAMRANPTLTALGVTGDYDFSPTNLPQAGQVTTTANTAGSTSDVIAMAVGNNFSSVTSGAMYILGGNAGTGGNAGLQFDAEL